MRQRKHIKRFMFGSAKYYVNDGNGSDVILKVDYEHNTYSLEDTGRSINEPFKQEVVSVAADLLKRKHGVNFAKQVR